MSWLDWLIVVVPFSFVVGMGLYVRRYIRGVSDFLAAGRLCGRYVINAADVANGLSIITLVAFVEVAYKTGFALSFWNNFLLPLMVIISLTGYCVYRFRETRAMSLGQFLEMRYNRPLRIFAAGLRSISEILANMICPAVAARFFIYYLDLPFSFELFGFTIPTFMAVVVVVLFVAVSIILMGGTLALIVTDTLQGLLCYPMLVVFIVFILCNFGWFDEVIPVMGDRAPRESFLNPFEIAELRDFNVFWLVVMVINQVMHRASWIGAGSTTAAKTPHEQKMANILGSWRTGIGQILYTLLAIMIITLLGHRHYAADAKQIRDTISARVAEEIVVEGDVRASLTARATAIPAHDHRIGVDAPPSQKSNRDTPYLDAAREALEEGADGPARFQEFNTLYHQMMLPVGMRHILPTGLMGLFCLLMVMMMVSTDDTRIFSASLTIAQDVVLPLKKGGFTPEGHVRLLRWTAVGVGLFWLFGSFFMAQLDYINMFIQIMTSLWLGGCGPVMIFGLYSRFGTSAGAFASLIGGMVCSVGGILLQRNWASSVYPWLESAGWIEPLDAFLQTVSGPFNPIILWEMNPFKFPINSYEIYFLTMACCLALYCGVSWLTLREPYNLERLLHRGKYNVEGDHKTEAAAPSVGGFAAKVVGITPEYTRGDRVIAWSIFLYLFGYKFCLALLGVIAWNWISPWPMSWWGGYFLVTTLVIPGTLAVVTTVWFSYGGLRDLRALFADLRDRVVDRSDDGRVEGQLSLADKQRMLEIDQEGEAAPDPSQKEAGTEAKPRRGE